jgi:hypothetical protein
VISPFEALKELAGIVERKEYIDSNANINVHVSPARSACPTAVVNVDTTYSWLYQRLKDEIMEELERTRADNAVELKELEQRTTEQVTR